MTICKTAFTGEKYGPCCMLSMKQFMHLQGLGVFLSKIALCLILFYFFCLKNIISFINNGDGSWWQLFSTS